MRAKVRRKASPVPQPGGACSLNMDKIPLVDQLRRGMTKLDKGNSLVNRTVLGLNFVDTLQYCSIPTIQDKVLPQMVTLIPTSRHEWLLRMTSNDILLYFFSNVTVRTIPVLARFMASRHEIGVPYWAGTMGGGGFQGWNHDQERATRKQWFGIRGSRRIGNRERAIGCGHYVPITWWKSGNRGHLPESNQYSVAWNKQQTSSRLRHSR
jgi:hypothetical protein